MPELPEVETVARGLAPLVGQRWEGLVVHRADLRHPLDEGRLRAWLGATVTAVGRRAKVLLLSLRHYHRTGTLRIHLGMSGRLYFAEPQAARQPHEHLEFYFSDAHLRYRDSRRFGWCDLLEGEALERWSAALAPEPWSETLTPAWARARAGRRSVKAALLSGQVVVGVGNIYANEALFRAGIAPIRLAATLSDAEWLRLIDAVRTVLAEAIAAGGTTLRDYVSATGSSGWFQLALAVYGREGLPCLRCGTPIACCRQEGRSSWWCPVCQPCEA